MATTQPWYVSIGGSYKYRFAALEFENALLNCRDEYVRLSVSRRAAFSGSIRSLVDFFEHQRRAERVEPTTTPEATLRAAGIGIKRRAEYQRKMSTLLGRGGS